MSAVNLQANFSSWNVSPAGQDPVHLQHAAVGVAAGAKSNLVVVIEVVAEKGDDPVQGVEKGIKGDHVLESEKAEVDDSNFIINYSHATVKCFSIFIIFIQNSIKYIHRN